MSAFYSPQKGFISETKGTVFGDRKLKLIRFMIRLLEGVDISCDDP